MDLNTAITQLQQHNHFIEAAITNLQRAAGIGRPGRPPGTKNGGAAAAGLQPILVPESGAETDGPVKRKRKGMSPAARKKQAQRMREFWAAKRKAAS